MLMKKVFVSWLFFFLLEGTALAENHSLSVGYTWGYLSTDGHGISDDGHPVGMNFKYRYEFNDTWGILGSFTFADDVLGGGQPAMVEWSYTSYMVGPSWRINDYISLYYLIGLARADTHINTSYTTKYKKNTLVSGLGVQINPWSNVVFDMGYEGAQFNDYPTKREDITSDMFTLGVGYRF